MAMPALYENPCAQQGSLSAKSELFMLLLTEIPLTSVRLLVKHAQTSTTENIYRHIVRTADEMAAEVREELFND